MYPCREAIRFGFEWFCWPGRWPQSRPARTPRRLTPCPADVAAPATPEPRDVLVASDVSAASRDESRAGDLLASASERGTVTLWPLDWLILARRDEARGDFTTAAARYRGYRTSLEGSGEDARWVEPHAKILELASKTATASGSAGALPESRLALADARAALARGDSKAAREKLGYAMRLDPRYVSLQSSRRPSCRSSARRSARTSCCRCRTPPCPPSRSAPTARTPGRSARRARRGSRRGTPPSAGRATAGSLLTTSPTALISRMISLAMS